MEINKTDSRVEALGEVMGGGVRYDERNGEYLITEHGEQTRISGARRRTFAELHRSGLIEPAPERGAEAAALELTASGSETAQAWGVEPIQPS